MCVKDTSEIPFQTLTQPPKILFQQKKGYNGWLAEMRSLLLKRLRKFACQIELFRFFFKVRYCLKYFYFIDAFKSKPIEGAFTNSKTEPVKSTATTSTKLSILANRMF